MIKFKKFLVDTFFPRKLTCNFCGREVFGDVAVCEYCKNSLPYNDGFCCFRCGRKTPIATEACESCSGREWFVDKARSAFNYDKPVSYAIHRFKYDNGRFLGEFFAEYLYPLYMKDFPACDCVIPVPISKERMKDRGFNQSELLAKGVSEKTGIPLYSDVVYKSKETERQVGLNARERMINLAGSFSVKNGNKIKGKTALLIDDVLTTGATSNYIAKILKKHGAEEVYLLTIASTGRKERIKTPDGVVGEKEKSVFK